MPGGGITQGKRHVLETLKRLGPSTAGELAKALTLTDVAVRQHLNALQISGIVEQRKEAPSGRGRPALRWSLAASSRAVFPDGHGQLSAALLEAAREEFGQDGVDRLLALRGRAQVTEYRELGISRKSSLKKRLKALTKRRTAEGYMAELIKENKREFLLVEHHCPILEAARCCQGLCREELELFQTTLGHQVEVERTEHVLSGGGRCEFRVRQGQH